MTKRYDSYKDSGVEWIGEIPSHWNKTKHKFNLSILSGYPFKSELFDNSEGFPLIRIRDISSGKIETYYQGEVLDKFVVKKGDLLIGMDGDFNTRWWDSEQGLLNQRCCSIFEGSDVLRRYLHFILPIELNIINDLTYYTTVKHLSVDDINNTDTILPPLSEQQQIVSFLDTKTSLIDSLIEKTQRKIELLKEKRTSLINEVVTKGLNPNVEMKDSGVEWIGEIPKTWSVSKIMFISKKVTDGSHHSPETQDSGKLYVTVSNVSKSNDIDFDSCSKISEESFSELERNGCRPKKGDVLITKDGTIGRGLVVGEFNEYVILSSIGLIRFSKKINPEYGLYYLLSGLSIDQMYSHVRGSGITRLTINLIKNLLFIIPPLSEQHQIIEYLDEQTQLIDNTISIEEKRIELLKEYCQSLISEVVTGKLKVTTDEQMEI